MGVPGEMFLGPGDFEKGDTTSDGGLPEPAATESLEAGVEVIKLVVEGMRRGDEGKSEKADSSAGGEF